MAILELCDLCNSKVKNNFIKVSIEGRITLIKGKVPPAPPGFVYADEINKPKGQTFFKVWDSFGKPILELNVMEKPDRHKQVKIDYELCETCGDKLIRMLEAIRKQYHIEQKKIESLERDYSPRLNLLDYFGDSE